MGATPPGRQVHGARRSQVTLTVDDVFAIYRWAFESSRDIDLSFLDDSELAAAVVLGLEDAAAGRSRSPAAVAENVEATLGVVLQPSPALHREPGDLRPELNRDLPEDIWVASPEAVKSLQRVRRRK